MTSELVLYNDYERGLVRQALYVAITHFENDSKDTENADSEHLKRIADNMRVIRARIEKDPISGW